jgi:hypothetical protein
MKSHSPVRFKNISLHWRLRLMVVVLVVSVLGLLTVYWVQLKVSNTQLQQDTLSLADQHTEQLAMAVARQAEDLIRGVDLGLRHMGHDYLEDPKSFKESVYSTIHGYPEGVILNIAVFDAAGEGTYNMVSANARVNVSDRDYFRAQAASSVDRVYVDRPIIGRVTHVWIIPVSRKLLRNGRFAGVIVVFLRADYVSRMLARIALHEGDVISLFTQEGAYLSRSNDLDRALGIVPGCFCLRQDTAHLWLEPVGRAPAGSERRRGYPAHPGTHRSTDRRHPSCQHHWLHPGPVGHAAWRLVDAAHGEAAKPDRKRRRRTAHLQSRL